MIALVISGVILYFPAATHIFKIHWLALAAVVILASGRRGKQRLSTNNDEPPRYQRGAWLGQLLFLQLCLSAVFLGISSVCGQSLPVLTAPQPGLFQQTLSQLLVDEGLFPWAFVALMAVSMGYYSYCKGQDAYLATTLSALTNHPGVKIIINFIGRLGTALAFASTFFFISLLWASVATTIPIITGFYLTPILLSVILILISLTKVYRRSLAKAYGKNIPLIPGLFFWVGCFAIAIWLINGFLGLITPIPMSQSILISHWLKQPWRLLWLIFANSWWLLWTPLAGITIARLSRGRQVRELIAATLALPLIIALVLALTQHLPWELTPGIASMITGVGLLGLLAITLHKNAIPAFILLYLPRRDHYKFRSYRSSLIKISQFAVWASFVYLPGGMTILHFLTFAAALPLILISISGIIALWFTE